MNATRSKRESFAEFVHAVADRERRRQLEALRDWLGQDHELLATRLLPVATAAPRQAGISTSFRIGSGKATDFCALKSIHTVVAPPSA